MAEKLSKYNKNGDEITCHGFVSNIEAFIQKLLSGQIDAQTNDYLRSHGIGSDIALKCLLAKNDDGPILTRKESIKTDKNTNKDKFHIKYRIVDNQKIDRQLRNLYIKLFEWRVTNSNLLYEEECGCCDGSLSAGANSASQSGQFTTPLFSKIKRRVGVESEDDAKMPDMLKERKKTVYLTESQMNLIKEALSTSNCGDYTYDAPAFIDKETADHKNMFAKSFNKKRKK